MATVQGAELLDVIVDGGESAKSLNRPDLRKLMALVDGGKVQAVIVAKLDRLTRSVKDLCGLLELFEKRKVALISVAEALDTGSAAGRLVITIMRMKNVAIVVEQGPPRPGFLGSYQAPKHFRSEKCLHRERGAHA